MPAAIESNRSTANGPRKEKRSRWAAGSVWGDGRLGSGANSGEGESDERGELSRRRGESLLDVGEMEKSIWSANRESRHLDLT